MFELHTCWIYSYLAYFEYFGMKKPGTIRSTKNEETVTATITQASDRYGRINRPKSMSKGVGRAISKVVSDKIGIISNMSCRSSLHITRIIAIGETILKYPLLLTINYIRYYR